METKRQKDIKLLKESEIKWKEKKNHIIVKDRKLIFDVGHEIEEANSPLCLEYISCTDCPLDETNLCKPKEGKNSICSKIKTAMKKGLLEKVLSCLNMGILIIRKKCEELENLERGDGKRKGKEFLEEMEERKIKSKVISTLQKIISDLEKEKSNQKENFETLDRQKEGLTLSINLIKSYLKGESI